MSTETIKTAKELCRHYLHADIPCWLVGPSGVGKSDLWQQLADEENIGFIDTRVSQLDPVDLRGVPSILNGTTMWNRPEFLPVAERDGVRGIFLLDELGDAPRSMQSACYQLILNRCIGPHKIEPGWYPCAASNDRVHHAAAQSISTALANRFAWQFVEADWPCWDEWAVVNGIHEYVRAFLKFDPDMLFSMEGADLKAFPTPRSWAKASRIMDAPQPVMLRLLRGLVGEGVSTKFWGFLKTLDLPDLDDILKAPSKCHIPTEPSSKYALSMMLCRKMTRQNIDRVLAYTKRPEFGRDFEVCTLLDAAKRDASLCETKAYTEFGARNQDLHL